MIQLSVVLPSTIQLRPVNKYSPEYESTKRSMASAGQLQPILVRPVGDQYEVVDGMHRYTIANDLGWREIKADIREMSDLDVMRHQIAANSRIPTSKLEYAQRLQEIQDLVPGLDVRTLADMVGRQPSWVKSQLDLMRLSFKAQTALDMGEIPVMNAYQLARLPAHEQNSLLTDAAILTKDEFAAVVDAKKTSLGNGYATNVEGFKPCISMRRRSQVESELRNGAASESLLKEGMTTEEAFRMGVLWAAQMDPITIDTKQRAYQQRKRAANDQRTCDTPENEDGPSNATR